MKAFPYKIAIVGLGPKGMYALERILAQLKASPVQQIVEIHLFNKTTFMGSGDVYRSDQPDYLQMNFSNKHINMWPAELPPPVVEHPLSLSEYLKKQNSIDEIDPLFSSRAMVGAYLENGYAQLCANLPENVIIHQHISKVGSIVKVGTHYSIEFEEQGETPSLSDFQNILISTGHQQHKTPDDASENEISFIYPVEDKLKNIREGQIVAIKGMGLTFIDAALALTEGRGGAFTDSDDGKLIYKATGKEPRCIFPFSKSGWPMLPKHNFNEYPRELYVSKLSRLKPKKLSFQNDILPLITQDMEFAYYRTLFAEQKELLAYHPNYDEVKNQINDFHEKHPQYKLFSMRNLLEPAFDSYKRTDQNILEYLKIYSHEKIENIEHKAQLRAAAVWQRFSPLFNELYSFSGLDAKSHQEFDQYYFGKFNRIAYGPPPQNLKKILALAEAGIINFQFARSPEIRIYKSGFVLSNDESEMYCDVLIDARIPKNAMEKEASGLFSNLCKNGLARPYVNRDENAHYAPGAVEINRYGK
ncbi:FAD/NAD(P)-binding protein [Marivirga sp.]|uniref:FAD/NAD(P)-binding protein n=1 Tax=Marivirga sp. TaxID=2018662 RepID=UPI0025FD2F17|nr:FAD/NAD(P)-binding protein [Marivirga sp.]